ncbi:MAG: DegT/DnrJ/EryC1/StrS family aminotransferase [Calditrichaeota bacterium]|nr:DegT/DnrJ/EryC1/StrS family aminotransferase [Calditrichota bacterium]
MPIYANQPFFPEEDIAEINAGISEILRGGRLTQGPQVDRFETEFAAFCGSRHAVAVNSGTAALEILLRYHQLDGGEVIVPTNTFLASANAVIFAGGRPVLADIHPETLCLDPRDLRRRITPQTRGVILVHIAGLITPHLEEIRGLCRQHGLFLIEDAAHAHGASRNGRMAGNLCDGGAFSFYPTKPMTTGEGGMITTNDEAVANFARSLRCHGIAIGAENRGDNKNLLMRLGHNWRMSEIQALVGRVQLKRFPEALAARRRVGEWYQAFLQTIGGVSPFSIPDGTLHSFYKYPVLLSPPLTRENIGRELRAEHQVQTGSIYWPPCHLQPFYREAMYCPGDFPVAEDILSRTLALPIYPTLSREEVELVCQALQIALHQQVTI